MKYRGPRFHQRFYGNSSSDYKQDDSDLFIKYMNENGYQKPVDVWLKSIKTILDLEMDLEGKWKDVLLKSIFPHDAMWFIMHTEMYFLAFCTPSDPSDEFIVTENCYNIHEGPNSLTLNPATGKYEVTSWTSYHEFSPITPKLMLILRSSMLPNEEEDANENVKNQRRKFFEMNRSSHVNPAAASMLQDLPITKPRNSYSRVTPQGIQLLPGEDGSPRSYHQFTFPFFKISTHQVHKINSLLLENAHHTSSIGFNSKLSMKRSLEYYLRLPSNSGFKVVHHGDSDVRLVYLRKLESIAKSLGSTMTLLYQTFSGQDGVEKSRKEALEKLQKEMLKHLPKQPTEFMDLYKILGT